MWSNLSVFFGWNENVINNFYLIWGDKWILVVQTALMNTHIVWEEGRDYKWLTRDHDYSYSLASITSGMSCKF